jgi:undecaprenyl-diphosphatase
MLSAALDITALGSATVLGLTVFAVAGFLLLQGLWRRALFVTAASLGGWFLNSALKQLFQRPRPDVVPHLREAMSMSFPSGHALTSAAVYLTLGALSMHIAQRRLTKVYCMTVAMIATRARRDVATVSRCSLSDGRSRRVLLGLSWRYCAG